MTDWEMKFQALNCKMLGDVLSKFPGSKVVSVEIKDNGIDNKNAGSGPRKQDSGNGRGTVPRSNKKGTYLDRLDV